MEVEARVQMEGRWGWLTPIVQKAKLELQQ